MGFLGNAKESPSIVFAEFHIEVLPLDLDLLRFDNIVHFGAECDRMPAFGKQKISLNFTTQKANIWPQLVTGGVCAGTDPGRVSDQQSQNQFVA
jgi:hypothetical protein